MTSEVPSHLIRTPELLLISQVFDDLWDASPLAVALGLVVAGLSVWSVRIAVRQIFFGSPASTGSLRWVLVTAPLFLGCLGAAFHIYAARFLSSEPLTRNDPTLVSGGLCLIFALAGALFGCISLPPPFLHLHRLRFRSQP